MLDAFVTADDVLRQAIQGISDLILVPGLINLDFADVKTIMSGMGVAMMGTAMAEGQTRAIDAANRAISSPLLEDASVEGARGVIINVTGGPDMSLMEVNEALTIIQESAHEDANIIFGAVVDPELHGRVKITVIATGFDHAARPSTAAARRCRRRWTWAPTRSTRRATRPPCRRPSRPRATSRFTITRRPGIDMPLAAPRPGREPGAACRRWAATERARARSTIPAFLRRSEG